MIFRINFLLLLLLLFVPFCWAQFRQDPGIFVGGLQTCTWVHVDINGQPGIRFKVVAQTTGYISIGWSVNTGTTGHRNADMILGFVSGGGVPTLLDTYSASAKSRPPNDASQDVTLISASEQGGVTTMEFQRLLNTNDGQDVAILDRDVLFQWAYHDSDNFARHQNFGSNFHNLFTLVPTQMPTRPPTPLTIGDAGRFNSPDNSYRLTWTTFDNEIEWTVSADTIGWIGLGMANKNEPAGHNRADMMIGWVDDRTGVATVYDFWSQSVKGKPPLDFDQNVEAISGSQIDGKTTITFKRAFNTGDPDDLPIIDDDILLHWSWHVHDHYATQQTHTRFGKGLTNFKAAGAIMFAPSPAQQPTTPPTPYTNPPTPAPTNPGLVQTPGAFTSPDGKYRLTWTHVGTTQIRFTVSADALGYVGVGWALLQTAQTGHTQADMVAAWVDDVSGVVTVIDGFSNEKSQPTADADQSKISDVQGTQVNGVTTVSFTRTLDTGDPVNDVALRPQTPVLLQWCYHSEDNYDLSFTHDFYGVAVADLMAKPGEQLSLPTFAPSLPPTPIDVQQPTSGKVCVNNNGFCLQWEAAADGSAAVDFTMTAQATGYVGVGWAGSEFVQKGHDQADMVVGWIDDNTMQTTLLDTFSNTKAQPVTDQVDNNVLLESSQQGSLTMIKFRRPFVTGDVDGDLDLINDKTLVQWCYHDKDNYEQGDTHLQYGMFVANLRSFGGAASEVTQPPTSSGTVEAGRFASPDGSFFATWTVDPAPPEAYGADPTAQDTRFITVTMTAQSTGYLAIGWAPADIPVAHSQLDSVTAWVDDNGDPHWEDGWSNSKARPDTDLVDNVDLLDWSETDGVTRIKFRRALYTSDQEQDQVVPNAEVHLQWCYHFNDNYELNEEHAFSGSGYVNLLLQGDSSRALVPGLKAGDFVVFVVLGLCVLRACWRCTSFVYRRYLRPPSADPAHTQMMALGNNGAGLAGGSSSMTGGPSTNPNARGSFARLDPQHRPPPPGNHYGPGASSSSSGANFGRGHYGGQYQHPGGGGGGGGPMFYQGSEATTMQYSKTPQRPENGVPLQQQQSQQRAWNWDDERDAPLPRNSTINNNYDQVAPADTTHFRRGSRGSRRRSSQRRGAGRNSVQFSPYAPQQQQHHYPQQQHHQQPYYQQQQQQQQQQWGGPRGPRGEGGHRGAATPGSRVSVWKEPRLPAKRSNWNRTGGPLTSLATRWHARLPGAQFTWGDMIVFTLYVLMQLGIVAATFVAGVDLLSWIADSMGSLATANSFLLALPATRNSLLTWALGVSFDRTIMFHRWLGRWTLLLVLLHVGFYVNGWLVNQTNLLQLTYLYGTVALVAGLVIFATSIAWVRRRHFQLFFWTHFIFFVFYVFAALHDAYFAWYAYAALAFYVVDRICRFFWGMWPWPTLSLEVRPGGLVRVQFPRHPLAQYRVGSYVFLNFPGVSLLEWHPFTLSSGPNDDCLEVCIKSMGDHTQKLYERARAGGRLLVRSDGPYGRFSVNHRRYPVVVCIGGGVGVTPMISCLKDMYRTGMSEERRRKVPKSSHVKHVYFVWVCPDRQIYSWFQDTVDLCAERSAASDGTYPEFHPLVHLTRERDANGLGPGVRVGRPNMDALFEHIVKKARGQRIAVLACGPTPLVNSAWDVITDLTASGLRVDFHSERFDF